MGIIYIHAFQAVLLVFFLSVLRGVATSSPPHIVTILSDDLGYFDRSGAGNRNVTTPNIDALYTSGMRLDRYYAYKVLLFGIHNTNTR